MTTAASRSRWAIPPVAIGLLVALVSPGHAAQPAVGLGTAGSYAVLAGSTVTNTGPSVIAGDLGVSPGTAVTGFPPGTVNGTIHAADAAAAQAESDLGVAYDDAAGRTPPVLVPGDLGGLLLTPGVYKRSSSLLLTGDVTLNAQGNPNAVFVIQVGSALTTASGSRVVLTGGAQACNVYWQIGSSATLGTDTAFRGNILALQSISLKTRATLHGRALARNGAVTLDTNTVTRGECAAGTTPGGATPPGGGAVPGGGGPGSAPATRRGAAFMTITPRAIARTVARHGAGRCVNGDFRVVVRGQFIRRVTFALDGRTVGTLRGRSPFAFIVHSLSGAHRLRARVIFSDGTRAANLSFVFRTCEQQVRRTPGGPGFTG